MSSLVATGPFVLCIWWSTWVPVAGCFLSLSLLLHRTVCVGLVLLLILPNKERKSKA